MRPANRVAIACQSREVYEILPLLGSLLLLSFPLAGPRNQQGAGIGCA